MPLTDDEMEKIADLVCKRLEMQLVSKPLGVSELATFLGVQKSWVYGQHDLPFFMAGKHKRFMVKEVLSSLGCALPGQERHNVSRAA